MWSNKHHKNDAHPNYYHEMKLPAALIKSEERNDLPYILTKPSASELDGLNNKKWLV